MSENMFLFRCIARLFSCKKSRLGDMTHLHKSVNTRAAKLLWRGVPSLQGYYVPKYFICESWFCGIIRYVAFVYFVAGF